ncbi:MAG: hypothetical protein QNJ68_08075 [Microcoleaceae cyanobacterium MO_207.B10]|nr:hypothetical protein [Microcoleaceae cyanobacterium MO_207.B10]
MSTTINTSTNNSETAKSLGIKIISVVGLTLFTSFYFNSWQNSLEKYAQQQAETNVATSTTDMTPTVANISTSESNTVMPSTAEVSPVVDTPQSVSTATEVTLAVPETQAAAKIIDSNVIDKLTSMLYNQIDKNWQQYPTFSENLVYRVTVNSAGNVTKYQHINKAASEYISETPLPKLTNNQADTNKPTAEFLVVLSPDGVLQVNHWTAE